MTHKARMAVAVGIGALLHAGSLAAHHSFEGEFDSQKVFTVKGVVTRFERINPHSFIYVDAKGENGHVERWALEGPGVLQLNRRSLNSVLKSGDSVEACGYATRDGVDTRSVRHITEALKDDPATGVSERRLLSAAVLTLPDGQKLLWSNYRKEKCVLDQ